jgi:hypothetical protein
MNDDDIMQMAREAGVSPLKFVEFGEPLIYPTPNAIERFAKLVAAAEREACAKLIENGRFLHDESPAAILAKEAAKAIRARGE